MATQVKRRRGTTAENDNFTGAMAEFTFDTETHHIRVHDGVKQGGYVIPVITDPLNPGSYTKVTIDDQGLVIGAEPLSADDLPNEIPMDKVFGLPLALENKQDKIYAGENIVIDETTISAIDTKYTAGEGIIISQDNVISSTGAAGVAKWGEIVDDIEKQTDLMDKFATKQDELTSANAGTNVSITKVGGVVKINATGGSGGTSDYTELTNKPSVNNVELSGNKSLSDLGIQPAGDYATTGELAEKQDIISDLGAIRTNASAGASAATTISGYGDIVTHNANEFALPGDIPTKTSELDNDSGFITSAYHDNTKQDKTDDSLSTVDKTVVGAINEIKDKVTDIEAARFVDATIIGEPSILQGQVSDFSTVSYLQFPFTLDLHEQAFDIYMCFTTTDNVQTQQNIIDSRFGLALAIQNGKGVMAISSNGTSWDIGSAIGTINIEANTTYYAKLSWNRLQYKTFLSTDGVNYTQDMTLTGAIRPFPTTIYIGGCNNTETGHTPHPFLGTINMNKARVDVMGVTIWQGMGDIGLATKANVSLDNLDVTGEARFSAKQDVISDIDTIRSNASDAKSAIETHTNNGTIHVTAGDKIAWSQKQNKLVAGANITIDETTNTISATGGATWLVVDELPENPEPNVFYGIKE